MMCWVCGDLNVFVFPCPKDNAMMWWAECFPALRTMLWCEGQCFPALRTMLWCEGQCFPALRTMLWCEGQSFPALRTMLWCKGQCFPALRTMLWCDGQSAPISVCTSVYLLHSHVIVNPLIAQHVHLKMEHYPCFRFCSAVKALICFRMFLFCFVFLAPQHILCKRNLFLPHCFFSNSCFITLYIYIYIYIYIYGFFFSAGPNW